MNHFKKLLVAIMGVLCAIYLANPTAGIFELLPDNLPFVGNLDEVGATLLLLKCLAYFGVRLRLGPQDRIEAPPKEEN